MTPQPDTRQQAEKMIDNLHSVTGTEKRQVAAGYLAAVERAERAEAALQRIADGEVWDVKSSAPTPVQEFARAALSAGNKP